MRELAGLALALTIVAAVVTSSLAATSIDVTRQPGASGADVVNAVVELIKANCVFPEDRMFLRRLAYVESTDGNDPDTYKQGYDGGIWKVSQAMLSATTSCPNVIRPTCDVIKTQFGIDWTNVTWADLRKPLFSGLAASLYLMTRLSSNTPAIPAAVESQAQLWVNTYHSGTPTRDFAAYTVNVTNYDCNDPMDIAFVVDNSGSINDADFRLSLGFVADVVGALDLSSLVRVALVKFATVSTVEISFNSNQNQAAIEAAIRGIGRGSSGGTNTALALDTTRSSVFTPAAGARDNVKRVAVLITDGQSADSNATAWAAERLRREAGAIVFSIGVGGYAIDELHAVASDPKCSHTYTLPDFSAIQSIINEIERSTCKAARYVLPNTTTVINNTGLITVNTINEGVLAIKVNCGIAHVYVSYTNPNPNPAMYSEMLTATDGHPAYLTTTDQNNGQPVYLTVVGSNLPTDAALLRNCTDFTATITETKEATIKCEVNHECRECTDQQIMQNSRIRELINCNDFSRFELNNPCSIEGIAAGHVLYPYAYSPNMFIRCDFKGRPYLTLCPNSMVFNPNTLTCGFDSGSGGSRVPLPSTFPNPCTPEHIQAEYLYFPYAPDKSMFIQCDLWGNAWLEQCPILEIWDAVQITCVAERPHQPATTHATVVNPCTPEAIAAGLMFHPYPCDHTRYIHCGIGGTMWVQFCPQTMYYDPASYICVLNDPQHDGHGCD